MLAKSFFIVILASLGAAPHAHACTAANWQEHPKTRRQISVVLLVDVVKQSSDAVVVVCG